ncbi:MAG: hypothetical protein ACI9D5_002704 [Candidatus Endobugula sp.]|jgi:hypothetical protein
MNIVNKALHKASLIVTTLLAVIALVAVFPVSYETLMTDDNCPYVWFIPACYLVSVGYALMLLSLLLRKNSVFLVGWTPVFLLALSGSVAEISGINVCPESNSGVPLCYFSLAFSLTIAATYFLLKKSKVCSASHHNA